MPASCSAPSQSSTNIVQNEDGTATKRYREDFATGYRTITEYFDEDGTLTKKVIEQTDNKLRYEKTIIVYNKQGKVVSIESQEGMITTAGFKLQTLTVKKFDTEKEYLKSEEKTSYTPYPGGDLCTVITKEYYKTGNLKQETITASRNGEIGSQRWRKYYETGELKELGSRSYRGGKIESELREGYYKNGKLEYSHLTFYYKNGGVSSETYREYDENGKFIDGWKKRYDEDGKSIL